MLGDLRKVGPYKRCMRYSWCVCGASCKSQSLSLTSLLTTSRGRAQCVAMCITTITATIAQCWKSSWLRSVWAFFCELLAASPTAMCIHAFVHRCRWWQRPIHECRCLLCRAVIVVTGASCSWPKLPCAAVRAARLLRVFICAKGWRSELLQEGIGIVYSA